MVSLSQFAKLLPAGWQQWVRVRAGVFLGIFGASSMGTQRQQPASGPGISTHGRHGLVQFAAAPSYWWLAYNYHGVPPKLVGFPNG